MQTRMHMHTSYRLPAKPCTDLGGGTDWEIRDQTIDRFSLIGGC